MNDFPKDVWQAIIEFIDDPKDYVNICCISKIVYRASLETRFQKGLEFSEHVVKYDPRGKTEYFVLPNQRLHGPYTVYSRKPVPIWCGYTLETQDYFKFGSKDTNK